jgi:alcohol dehydrogenase class IV
MKDITIYNPKVLSFGCGAVSNMVSDYIESGKKRIFVLTAEPIKELIKTQLADLQSAGISITINTQIQAEPSVSDFNDIITEVRDFNPDSVLGIGGGSVLDTAKIIALCVEDKTPIEQYFGIGLIHERKTHLVCIPTTSGTGSEVSPNSIILDDTDGQKKGIISPHLVPDASYVDPELSYGLPPHLTAYTGIDALTHCIEAYANKFAHPVVDFYALKGIQLIAENLEIACKDGQNKEARSNVALGSMYGGICLGPVNTGAVHALAYPLGNDYKITHGLSNAVLLPYVLDFNIKEAPDRYADIAKVIGVKTKGSQEEIAQQGLEKVKSIMKTIQIPDKLSALGVLEENIENMAESALKVQRLLKNNLREVTFNDAVNIYRNAY